MLRAAGSSLPGPIAPRMITRWPQASGTASAMHPATVMPDGGGIGPARSGSSRRPATTGSGAPGSQAQTNASPGASEVIVHVLLAPAHALGEEREPVLGALDLAQRGGRDAHAVGELLDRPPPLAPGQAHPRAEERGRLKAGE